MIKERDIIRIGGLASLIKQDIYKGEKGKMHEKLKVETEIS